MFLTLWYFLLANIGSLSLCPSLANKHHCHKPQKEMHSVELFFFFFFSTL